MMKMMKGMGGCMIGRHEHQNNHTEDNIKS
jgi:hypothetical protein